MSMSMSVAARRLRELWDVSSSSSSSQQPLTARFPVEDVATRSFACMMHADFRPLAPGDAHRMLCDQDHTYAVQRRDMDSERQHCHWSYAVETLWYRHHRVVWTFTAAVALHLFICVVAHIWPAGPDIEDPRRCSAAEAEAQAQRD